MRNQLTTIELTRLDSVYGGRAIPEVKPKTEEQMFPPPRAPNRDTVGPDGRVTRERSPYGQCVDEVKEQPGATPKTVRDSCGMPPA